LPPLFLRPPLPDSAIRFLGRDCLSCHNRPLSLHPHPHPGRHRRPLDRPCSLFLPRRLAIRKSLIVFLLGHRRRYRPQRPHQRTHRHRLSLRHHLCFPAPRPRPPSSPEVAPLLQHASFSSHRRALAHPRRSRQSPRRPGQGLPLVLLRQRTVPPLSRQALSRRLRHGSPTPLLRPHLPLVPSLELIPSPGARPDSPASAAHRRSSPLSGSRSPAALLLASRHSSLLQLLHPPGVLSRPWPPRSGPAAGPLAGPRSGGADRLTHRPRRAPFCHSPANRRPADRRHHRNSSRHFAHPRPKSRTLRPAQQESESLFPLSRPLSRSHRRRHGLLPRPSRGHCNRLLLRHPAQLVLPPPRQSPRCQLGPHRHDDPLHRVRPHLPRRLLSHPRLP